MIKEERSSLTNSLASQLFKHPKKHDSAKSVALKSGTKKSTQELQSYKTSKIFV